MATRNAQKGGRMPPAKLKKRFYTKVVGGTTEDIGNALEELISDADKLGYDPVDYITPPMRDALLVVFRQRRRERTP